jgi:hypothetical protein
MPNVLPFKSKQEKDEDLVKRIVTLAYEGFITMGRGALIHEPLPFTPGYCLRYVELGNAEFELLGDYLPEFTRRAENYDPETEFILVFLGEDEFEVDTRRVGNRPTLREEWEWEQERREWIDG